MVVLDGKEALSKEQMENSINNPHDKLRVNIMQP